MEISLDSDISQDSLFDSMDRKLLNLSSQCLEPALWAWENVRYRLVTPLVPGSFDNASKLAYEIGIRALIAFGALFSISTLYPIAFIASLAIVGKFILRPLGFAFQKSGFTHVRGELPEKQLSGQAKVMNWNVLGAGGGLNFDHGGVNSWRSRLSGIVQTIRDNDPDVLVLEEIYDTALAESLIKELKDQFAHFYIHLGPNTMGSVGGLMVLSKCAEHRFTNTSFQNNSWDLNRTFATLEIKASPSDTKPCARIIGTHFIHDNNEKRLEQLAQVLDTIQDDLPTLLVGDLNLERDDENQGKKLDPHFERGYIGDEPTCTSRFTAQWNPKRAAPEETIDDIRLHRGHRPEAKLENVRLIEAYSLDSLQSEALSDHQALIAELTY